MICSQVALDLAARIEEELGPVAYLINGAGGNNALA